MADVDKPPIVPDKGAKVDKTSPPADSPTKTAADSFAWGALAFVAMATAAACAVAGVAIAPAALAVAAVVFGVLAFATATGLTDGVSGAGRAASALIRAGAAAVVGDFDRAWQILADVDLADWLWLLILTFAAFVFVRNALKRKRK